MFEGLFSLLTSKDYRFRYLAAKGFYKNMPDDEYLKRMFRIRQGMELNLDDPKTFNEKLQWLKINDRNPLYTTMVDKYAAKEYVAGILGEEYIIPTLGVWDSVEDIPFDSLPNQFVLKCTHDSHGVVVCRDKASLNIGEVKKKLSKALKEDYYQRFREWPYKNVKPRIIVEQYMEEKSIHELRSEPFRCFVSSAGGLSLAKGEKEDVKAFLTKYPQWCDAASRSLRVGQDVILPVDGKESDTTVAPSTTERIADLIFRTLPALRVDTYEADEKTLNGDAAFYPVAVIEPIADEVKTALRERWVKVRGIFGDAYVRLFNDLLVSFRNKVIEVNPKAPLRDYKVYTFGGKAKILVINQDRGTNTKGDYFDPDYRWLDFTWGFVHADVPPDKPKHFDEMLRLAEKLAKGFTELRVDFYDINGQIYFGELTFFDGSGFDRIDPIEMDYTMGSWVNLPKK